MLNPAVLQRRSLWGCFEIFCGGIWCKNFKKIPAFEVLEPFTIVSLKRCLPKTFGPAPQIARTGPGARCCWWCLCVSVSASASPSERSPFCTLLFLHRDHLLSEAQRRCFSTSARRWPSSRRAFSSALWFPPSADVDRTSAGTSRSAARRATTPPRSPVASSSWTRPTTTSPWWPGNFPGCSSCCSCSRWDTLCSGCCAPGPGSSHRRTTDTRPSPRLKSRWWRAAHRTARWSRVLPLSCRRMRTANVYRHMRKLCGKGTEDGRGPTSDRLHDKDAIVGWDGLWRIRHLRLYFIPL